MYIFKNALLNIKSSIGRNVLIGLIVFVIAVSSCVALSIKDSAKKAEAEGLKNLEITANISFDRQKLMENNKGNQEDFRNQMANISELSLDELMVYEKSQYVKEFRYNISSSVNGSGIDPVTDEDTSSNNTENKFPQMPGGGRDFISNGDFSIKGYNSLNSMTSFVNGTSKVTEGEIFDLESNEYQCIINSELSAYNDINVGDTITITNPNNEEQTFDLIVKGIYTTSDTESEPMRFSTAQNPANQIYTSYNTLNSIVKYTEDNATTITSNNRERSSALRQNTNGTYVFENVSNYESFKEDVKTLGLSDDYTVNSTDLTNYENSLIPIKNTVSFANMMLSIVLIIGGIILVVLNMFNIRERKYEVGVLTAIGMKKYKVAIQFVIELFIITSISIVLGSGVGAVVSVPTANSLLQNQIQAQQAQQYEQLENFRPNGGGNRFEQIQNVDYISSINATMDISVLYDLMMIGMGLTILSSLAAVVFIMRYEPLKILSERN